MSTFTVATTVPDAVDGLAPWVQAGVFGPAEAHGAEVLTRSDAAADPLVQLAAAFALWAPLHGHSCVDVRSLADVVRATIARTYADDEAAGPAPAALDREWASLPWPDADAWLAALTASPLCRLVAAVDTSTVLDQHALVLHGSRLYTQRQWIDECSVARQLRDRTHGEARLNDDRSGDDRASADRQQQAVTLVTRSNLAVIVGGPGTGKTYTIVRALEALAAGDDQPLSARVALAAPTGKAAGRLTEAVRASSLLAGAADLQATTIHRLLGTLRTRTRFRHDSEHHLPYDTVVVDEASMVALPLMARLVEALRPDARLVLVGDPEQLQSIEVGTVLADIVQAAERGDSGIAASVVRLDRSHRQGEQSPIGPLADAIREGRADDVVSMLRAGHVDRDSGLATMQFIEHSDAIHAAGGAGVRDVVLPPFSAAMAAARQGDADEALRRLAGIRLLCAHRAGPYGVSDWNRIIETWLLAASGDAAAGRPSRFYPGRPLLATRNDFRLRIANGDTGIVVAGAAGIRAAFSTSSGTNLLAPAQLEAVETAYAMTIHKSQGSEYATVVVVLPPATSPLIGRELLYTAVTRTTDRLIVAGTADAVRAAVNTRGHRVSGLAAAL